MERSVCRMQRRCERAAPEKSGEARCRPPRRQAWLRGRMVSPNEAGFNLREIVPLSRNILHSRRLYGTANEPAKRIAARRLPRVVTDRNHLKGRNRPPDPTLFSIRDTAKSGMGCQGNRHLNDLAESTSVNVGGSCPDAKVRSRPMMGTSVGAPIVVRARESRVHGEGVQSLGIPEHR